MFKILDPDVHRLLENVKKILQFKDSSVFIVTSFDCTGCETVTGELLVWSLNHIYYTYVLQQGKIIEQSKTNTRNVHF